MSAESNTTSKETPASFFLTRRYQVFLPFTDKQIEWLLLILSDFEREVLNDSVESWLRGILYLCWFAWWPENPDGMFCQAEEEDDRRQRKVALLQIFTMHLEHRWHMPRGLPEEVGAGAVCEMIVGLHAMIDDMTSAE
ncbi:hypothetical protein ARMSODRAFT_1021090 [Armillaria solidipes]|uniref:Uncharacterized protein n=1 Tax=Armillaria solidipes TaxID=1076256 RepID=A0A2H3BHX8_9AGAR|nr:hypothetical protein ARMSODRAFT_1021090 [Armillaria solidipes]